MRAVSLADAASERVSHENEGASHLLAVLLKASCDQGQEFAVEIWQPAAKILRKHQKPRCLAIAARIVSSVEAFGSTGVASGLKPAQVRHSPIWLHGERSGRPRASSLQLYGSRGRGQTPGRSVNQGGRPAGVHESKHRRPKLREKWKALLVARHRRDLGVRVGDGRIVILSLLWLAQMAHAGVRAAIALTTDCALCPMRWQTHSTPAMMSARSAFSTIE